MKKYMKILLLLASLLSASIDTGYSKDEDDRQVPELKLTVRASVREAKISEYVSKLGVLKLALVKAKVEGEEEGEKLFSAQINAIEAELLKLELDEMTEEGKKLIRRLQAEEVDERVRENFAGNLAHRIQTLKAQIAALERE